MVSDILIYNWVEKNWNKLVKKAQTYDNEKVVPISVQIERKFKSMPRDASNIARSVAIWKNFKF